MIIEVIGIRRIVLKSTHRKVSAYGICLAEICAKFSRQKEPVAFIIRSDECSTPRKRQAGVSNLDVVALHLRSIVQIDVATNVGLHKRQV